RRRRGRFPGARLQTHCDDARENRAARPRGRCPAAECAVIGLEWGLRRWARGGWALGGTAVDSRRNTKYGRGNRALMMTVSFEAVMPVKEVVSTLVNGILSASS